MVKAAKEIQMENPREAETHSTGATCSPSEERAEKPSMLCFKKRKKSCKEGLAVKDVCEGASEEKSQCVSADQGEAKVPHQSRSSKGAWAAIKSLTRPRRTQKSSSRKKVPSDSQVRLEVDAEEGCVQGFPKKRVSSRVKMPCVRFSRGKKKPSPSEAVEESEGSVQANEVMGVSKKTSEEPEGLAPADKSESFSPVSAEEDQDTAKESANSVGKSEPLTEPAPDAEEEDRDTAKESADSVGKTEPLTEPAPDAEEEDWDTAEESADSVGKSEPLTGPAPDAEEEDQDTAKESADSVGKSEPLTEPAPDAKEEDQDTAKESADSVGKRQPLTEPAPDAEEHTECTAQSEITDSETVNETAQEKLQEESRPQTTACAEGGEVAPEAHVPMDQPSSTPETTELQEIPSVRQELPEGDGSEKSIILPEEYKAEETVMDSSQSAFKGDAGSVQGCSSHQVTLEANAGAGVSIVITVTEAEDSDNTDSDQAYEPSPVLHRNKQKGNKKSSRSFDFGKKEGPEAGGDPQAEEKGLGDQGHRTGEQYELLLIETASSLVKAAIQSSIEQLVNEMALEQNKHNSFL